MQHAEYKRNQNKPKLSIIYLPLMLALMLLCGFNLQAATQANITLSATSTDSQIQTALDQISDGGEVVLPPGTYQIHQPIMLRRDNQVLRGSGPNTILFLADKANCPVIILGSPMKATHQAVTHLRLADLSIDGNRKNQQAELWHTAIDGSQLNNNGVDIWDVDGAMVEHVSCYRCRSGGLVTAVTRHLNLNDYTAYDNQYDGLACYLTEDSHFTDLHLHDNVAAGISLDLAFNHNVIENALLTGNELGIFMRYSHDNVFKKLTISKSRKDGVFMAQSAAPSANGWILTPGTECTGNNFDGLIVDTCGRNAFLVNNASCKDNVIRGARFLGNAVGGLVEGDGQPCTTSLTLVDAPVAETKPALPSMQAIIMPHAASSSTASR